MLLTRRSNSCAQRYTWQTPGDTTPKTFKGSVFVEWSTVEEAKAVLEAGPLRYKEADEAPLVLKSKLAYFKEKSAQYGSSSPNKKRKHAATGGAEGGRSPKKAAAGAAAADGAGGDEPPPAAATKDYVKGACLRFEGLPSEGVTREVRATTCTHTESRPKSLPPPPPPPPPLYH